MGKKYTNFEINLNGLENKEGWYTIATAFNYEKKVSENIKKLANNENLSDKILDVFVPIATFPVETVIRGKKTIKMKEERILGNYVFVKAKLTLDVWKILTNITGVSAVLCTSGIPTATSEKEILNMKEYCGVA